MSMYFETIRRSSAIRHPPTAIRLVLLLLAAAAGAQAAGNTADLARRIGEAGLDPDACFHVRDLSFNRGDIRFYFNEGFLIFGKPVDGERLTAIFSAETEGGDAEILVLPPTRSERLSLAGFTHSPNLNEHFRSAILVFSDDSFSQLDAAIRKAGEPHLDAERGVALAEEWRAVARNFSQSFQVRLVRDLRSEFRSANGLFYAAVRGSTLGNFDVMFDPRQQEQITIGQVATKQERTYFDVWTHFADRAFRQGRRTVPADDVSIRAYRIEATLEPSLAMRVRTLATVVPGVEGKRALSFEISSQMRVTEAKVDGVPAEVFQPESLRSNLIRGATNDTFLLVPAEPLQPGREYEVEFRHEGSVVTDAGNKVYFVGARGSWYPNRYAQFARFEMTFRYPLELDLVATGKAIETRTDGEWRIARYRTDVPVRMAGFNLGHFDHEAVAHGGYNIDVYANHRIETALQQAQPRVRVVPRPPTAGQPRWTVDIEPVAPMIERRNERLEQIASEIAAAVDFMSPHLGPPILKQLTVSPIPGSFGQGFPGLIYLSTLAYLDASQLPAAIRGEYQQMFYTDIMQAHETAHQWWGNVVTAAGPPDNWLMEALANYMALMYLESKKGPRALETVLTEYRTHLLATIPEGRTVESSGPIVWDLRLLNSQLPAAWRLITYEKGSWIIHMLRRRIGDDSRFLAMLGQLRKRYQYKGINTEEFRRIAVEFLPPKSPDPQLEGFFDQFVYGTGVPTLKLDWNAKGAAPNLTVTGTVTQTEVDEDFSAFVPVELQFARGKPLIQWVRTSTGNSVPFKVAVKQKPVRVVLDPNYSVLRK